MQTSAVSFERTTPAGLASVEKRDDNKSEKVANDHRSGFVGEPASWTLESRDWAALDSIQVALKASVRKRL